MYLHMMLKKKENVQARLEAQGLIREPPLFKTSLNSHKAENNDKIKKRRVTS